MKPASTTQALSLLGQLARGLVLLSLAYWSLFALLAPVTVWDSHVYNLGRLPLTSFGGLWHNPYWTTERQIIFPLTFDAIHAPLLKLGAAYALPSFLCFLGLCAIVWYWLERWRGADDAWLALLALCAMPTMVFQAVGTKNDLAVVFGLAAWGHSLLRWHESPRLRYLIVAAVALGFAAGAKTSGVPLAALAGLLTLASLRRHGPALRSFLLAAIASALLLGSTETYVFSQTHYGHPIGPANFRNIHENKDGLRGTLANATRYVAGNLSTGIEPCLREDTFAARLDEACRSVLRHVGLSNVGYRSDFDDAHLHFGRYGGDTTSDYGPIGTLALVLAGLALVWWRPRALWWRFAVAGHICFWIVCVTVAWMPWNNRFLLAPFGLWAIALVLASPLPFRWLILVVAGWSEVIYPLHSGNKRPVDLISSVTLRDEQQFSERKELLLVWNDALAWRRLHPTGHVFLLAGGDSWVLPFLDSRKLQAEPITPSILPDRLTAIADDDVLLVILNRSDFSPVPDQRFKLLKSYPEQESALWQRQSHGTAVLPPDIKLEAGFSSDGGSADRPSLAVDTAFTPPGDSRKLGLSVQGTP